MTMVGGMMMMMTATAIEEPMSSGGKDSDKTTELPSLATWHSEELPLVLLTVGDGVDEFEALYDHLESISRDPLPKQLSLIVTRPETPDVLYQTLRARTKEMPHVHIRRLDDAPEDCDEILHETGKFYVTRPRSKGEA